LLPSFAEGLPLALQEAMMCGRPSLVSNIAGNPELVKDGINGYLIDLPSVLSINAKLEKAWDERHLWEEMGKKAHEWASNYLDLEPEKTLYNYITNTVT